MNQNVMLKKLLASLSIVQPMNRRAISIHLHGKCILGLIMASALDYMYKNMLFFSHIVRNLEKLEFKFHL